MALAPIELSQVAAGSFGFVINGAGAGDNAGRSVAAAGDLNGDGFADIILGAPFADPAAGANGGRAYVVFGRAQPFAAAVDLAAVAAGTGGFTLTGRAAGDAAGWAVAGAGDVNADGFADILVGAFNAASSAGETYVVFGGAAGFPASVDLATVAAGTGGFAVQGAAAGDRSGHALGTAGDFDGDGFDDILVGAYGAASFAGRSYLVFGGAAPAGIALTTLDANASGFAIKGEAKADQSGFAISGLGDINGDGLADIVIGARFADTPAGTDSGRSYVMFGTAERPATAINLADIAAGIGGFAINGGSPGDLSGHTVAAAGDINGDSIADFVIATPFATVGDVPYAGQTYVIFGQAGGFGATLNLADVAAGKGGFVLTGEAADDLSGVSASAAGDLNGDGFDDLVVGAHLHDLAARPDAGRSYVLLGRAGGFGASVSLADIAAGTGGFAINGQTKGGLSGFSVAAGGDINGDGFDDLLVGAYAAATAAGAEAGRSYVILGRDFTGTVTHPGTTSPDSLTGSAAADSMVGGQGNDTIRGNGGADVLLGGQGDDTLRLSDLTFRRIDGGSGHDTLALDAAGVTLDLAAIADTRIKSVEVIDLTGAGGNALIASALDVRNLSETGNTLRVLGNADDSVTLQGASWSLGSGPAGFATYINGSARVEVAEAVMTVPCFTSGSHITTAEGEVRVEDLREGDIAILADGRRRPVRWIGHRTLQIARHKRPWDVQPIRIRADAFGPGQPYRDLRLSPDHAVFAHGQLVPIRHLVNGATITQEHVGEITYFHVELAGPDGRAAHDILLAEGLAVESFLDTGNRSAFANGGAALQLHPDFALRAWEANACAPLLRDGAALADLRTELQAEATALGWDITSDPDLRLLVDGRPVWPLFEGGRYVIRLPEGARAARLRSHRTMPAWLRADTDDRRILGVAITRMVLDGRDIAFDDPRLSAGWHAPEADLRWTDGDAALPIAGGRVLELWTAPLERYWRAPRRFGLGKRIEAHLRSWRSWALWLGYGRCG